MSAVDLSKLPETPLEIRLTAWRQLWDRLLAVDAAQGLDEASGAGEEVNADTRPSNIVRLDASFLLKRTP